MPRCIEKLSHSCGSSDGLQVFCADDDTYNGYCYACSTYVADPYNGGKPSKKANKNPSNDKEEMADIATCPIVAFPDRKLRAETLAYFGIRAGVSGEDGKTVAFHFYPEHKGEKLVGYTVRMLPKKFWSVGDIKDADPFGWKQAQASGAKALFICEGHLDAASLFQAIKDRSAGTRWAERNPAVVAVRGTGVARRQLSSKLNEIRSLFSEIILVFDNDDAGEEAKSQVMQLLPEAKAIQIPGKDPSDCLMKGHGTGMANAALFRSITPKNTRIVWANDRVYTEASLPPRFGIPWPWDGMTDLTRGIRKGETLYLGAGVKLGKSEVVNTLAAHLIVKQDWKVFLAKPEEANLKTVKLVLGKVAGKIFHDPKVEFDKDAYREASKLVGDRLGMLNLYQHVGWGTLRTDIVQAAEAGAQAVFVDPITNLTNGIASGEANTVLQGIAQELAALARDLDIVVFIFCHLKAPDAGAPHERGGAVMSHQFSGSRAMMRSCNYMIGLEGNKDPDLTKEERNMRKLVLLEDREYGEVGAVHLYWDYNTGLFHEVKDYE